MKTPHRLRRLVVAGVAALGLVAPLAAAPHAEATTKTIKGNSVKPGLTVTSGWVWLTNTAGSERMLQFSSNGQASGQVDNYKDLPRAFVDKVVGFINNSGMTLCFGDWATGKKKKLACYQDGYVDLLPLRVGRNADFISVNW